MAAIGARADSGDVVFGETFDTEEDFARWTLVDNNGGRTWEYLNGAAAYMLDYQTGLPGASLRSSIFLPEEFMN